MMEYNKEYFRRKVSDSNERFANLSNEEKLKYLATAERMSAKVRSEMVANLDLGAEYLFFYGAQSPFSQWHKCSFTIDGIKFACTEQYMMYMKARLFHDNDIAAEILNSGYSPEKNKAQGRKVKNFDQAKWEEHRTAIVWYGNYNKFYQNKTLLSALLKTSPRILVEASSTDQIWGIGLSIDDPNRFHQEKWRGSNLLGYILTSVREELQK